MFQCDNCGVWFSPLAKNYSTTGKGKNFKTFCPQCTKEQEETEKQIARAEAAQLRFFNAHNNEW